MAYADAAPVWVANVGRKRGLSIEGDRVLRAEYTKSIPPGDIGREDGALQGPARNFRLFGGRHFEHQDAIADGEPRAPAVEGLLRSEPEDTGVERNQSRNVAATKGEMVQSHRADGTHGP